jgi:hypothetical protein
MQNSRRVLSVLAVTAAAATCVPASATALPRTARITTAGLGAIKIGMTERQVERAGNRRIRLQGGAGSGDCRTATMGGKLYGLFTGDRLARIYVGSRRYATRSGIRVGATESDVYDTYPGQIVSRPHQYDPAGHYLEIHDGNRKVVFETDGKRVEQISTGRLPEIDYVEGCA